MIRIQKKYIKIIHKLAKSGGFLFLRKKIIVFSLVVLPLTSVGAGMTIYIDNLANTVQEPVVVNNSVITLDEKIIVQFAAPIHDTDLYETVVTTFPNTDLTFSWSQDSKKVTIIPRTIWKPETEYSIAFPYNYDTSVSKHSAIFSFETVAYPKVISTNISEDNEQYLSEGDDILITFDHDISHFDVHAVTRPILKTEQTYNKEDRTLRIHIKERLQNNTGFHSLTVFAKHNKQKDANFYPIHSLTFNTLLPQPESWPKQHTDRLHIAQLSTPPQIRDGKYIDVNTKAQITTLFENGKFVKNFMNSPGAEETPTVHGRFAIYNKDPYALSNMFNVYLPYWMAFTEDGLYGFHGLVVWPKGHEDMPDGGKESVASIGNAVSPGCVRHDAQMSKFIYEWAEIGTPVIVY